MTDDSSNVEYTIQFTPLALEMLGVIKDQRELKVLEDRINKLKIDSEKQGKALVDNLMGYRSVRDCLKSASLRSRSPGNQCPG